MKLKTYLSFLFVFVAIIAQAQTIEIKGTVTDSKNKQPLSGTNVVVKNSKKGVKTDADGNFAIKVKANDILLFSNMGYATKEVQVENAEIINIALVEEINKLEEIVINVGYGTQKKKNLSSAISTIKSDAFEDRPLYSVGQAIQGNAAGVNVVQPSGKPGVGLDIRIRGLSSINSGNNPLYVIDGVQTYSTDGINTDDVVDIQILKDATATAIYGVNGSAGVILITTKRGKANKNVFSFSSYLGTSKIVKNTDILTLDQYKTLISEIDAESGNNYLNDVNSTLYTGINTDWVKEVFQTGEDRNIDFSYAGGNDKLRTFASLGYQDVTGIVKPSNFTRLSGRLNLDVDATTWLKAHANMNLIKINLNNTSDNNSANQGGVILSALTTPAFLPIYADQLTGRVVDPVTLEYADGYKDGQFAANPTASLENPVAFQSRQEETNTVKYLANLGLDITLAKNLVWKPSTTIDMYRSVYEYFVDSYRSNYGRGISEDNPELRGIGRQHTTREFNWNVENTLNYTIKKGNHDISLLAGTSMQELRYDQLKIEGTGFAPDVRSFDLSAMAEISPTASDTIAREKTYLSHFGRATYIYKGKYILNGVFRASGSSQLAPGNKWGYFPGISAAWIISNEDFMKNVTAISELKLRGGWGQTGNINNAGYYAWYSLLKDDAGPQDNYENKQLTWETTTDLNLGLDIGLLNNRIKINMDVFKRNTTDLFQDIKIANIPYFYNKGEIENKGFEFALNTVNFKGDFSWNTNFNISFIQNNILDVGNYQKIYDYADVNRVQAGVSLGNFYGYVVDRVNPDNGVLEYKDVNGDGTVDADDRTTIGNALPDYTFGFTNNFSYKGFSLDLLFTGSQGNDIFNKSRIDLEGMKDNKNQSVAVLDRWQQAGDITDIPGAASAPFNGISPTAISSRYIEDGSYVRLKSATIGYSFKKLYLGLKSLKLYATGQNLVTWTNYSGFDPEVSANGGNTGTAQGIDYGTYPQVRTFIFGLKAGF